MLHKLTTSNIRNIKRGDILYVVESYLQEYYKNNFPKVVNLSSLYFKTSTITNPIIILENNYNLNTKLMCLDKTNIFHKFSKNYLTSNESLLTFVNINELNFI